MHMQLYSRLLYGYMLKVHGLMRSHLAFPSKPERYTNRKNLLGLISVSPIIWGLMWQAFGAAIALPLYFRAHLRWVDKVGDRLSSVDVAAARSLPASFIFGALLPAIIGMLPTWYPRSDVLHQNILAAWQPDPVWVSILQAIQVFVLSSRTRNNERAVWWTRLSYLLAALSSATGHIYGMGSILMSTDPAMTIIGVYVPFIFTGPDGAIQKLANGTWLFLQYDLIIISISCISWAYLLVLRTLPFNTWIRSYLLIILMSSSAVLGPGATVSLSLFWREGYLSTKRMSKYAMAKSQ